MFFERWVKSGGDGMSIAPKECVDVDWVLGEFVVEGSCRIACLLTVSPIAPITRSSLGPLKLNMTLRCLRSWSFPIMISEHNSLITSATTPRCSWPFTLILKTTSPIILATCLLSAKGTILCFGMM